MPGTPVTPPTNSASSWELCPCRLPPLIRRIGAVFRPLDHLPMDEPTKPSGKFSVLRDYWNVFCAALLISVVVYAVVTA